MSRVVRSALAGFLVAAVSLWLLFAGHLRTVETASANSLEAGGGLRWYRGNLHTHSLWSDGDDYLEMIALWYKEHGYDFLCFTDHNVLANRERWSEVEKNKGGRIAFEKLQKRFPENWVETRSVDGPLEVRLKTFDEVSREIAEPGRYLLIQGEEISDKFGRFPLHLNVSNVKELIPPLGGESVADVIQNNMDAVAAQRERTGQPMIVHLNHPNFGYAVTAEDLFRIRGEKFFEVYNGHPGVHNSGDELRASTERIWDIVLSQRLGVLGLPVLYGLATDDGHNYHKIPSRASEPGRGWVMVLANELTPAALIESLEAGRFYASSGVNLLEVTTSNGGLKVRVEAILGIDYKIEFIGTRKGFDPQGHPVLGEDGLPIRTTQSYSDKIGDVLATVEGAAGEYRFNGDEIYVRARITSSKEHPNPSEFGELERAWVQPLAGPAARQR